MAMSILLLGTASCSQNEIDETGGVITPDSKAVTLGVNVGVNTGDGQTKSAVTGTKITYETKDYASVDHAIGLVVTDAAGTAYYKAETPNFDLGYTNYGTGQDICFVGDESGQNWKAIDAATFPSTAATAKTKTFFLDKNIGQVFAYFPFDKTKKKKATIGTDGKVTFPIEIVATSAKKLGAATVNSKLSYQGSAWSDNADTKAANIMAEETDYLYFLPTTGRKVNNGTLAGADGTVTPPDGTNADDNPGNNISLSMKHALSMVTFRLYDKDLVTKAPTGAPSIANLGSIKSFKIENVAATDGPLKIGSTTMNLAVATEGDNPIDETASTYTSGTIERNLENYYLIRARQTGAKDDTNKDEAASASTYLHAEGGNGKDVANYISTLVYPIATMEANSIKVTFDVLEAGAAASKSFPLTTVLTVPDDGGWLPNKNYIYTFSVSKKGLNVVDVTVTDWTNVEVGEVVDL